jgi:nicotinamide-nucleotide amidase
MDCEIVTIGTELLLGHIVDTNAAHLARNLNLIGVNVAFHSTVGDNYGEMKEVLSQAFKRTDLVITSGGLGPTEDDMTREVVADVMGVPLVFKQELMDHIESFFRRIGYRMPENNRKQAFIPDGALVIPNEVGTAPGFIVEKGPKVIVSLPGVPRELKYLLEKEVLPYVRKHFHLDRELITSKILKVTGVGESKVDTEIKDLMDAHFNPTVGLLASPGDISIRITAVAKNAEEAEELIRPIEQKIRSRLGIIVYGVNDDTLEGVVTNLLVENGHTLSVIENVSGGEVTTRLRKSFPSPLKKSIVIEDAEQAASFLYEENSPVVINRETCETLAERIRAEGKSTLGLALLGTLQKTENRYEVNAHIAVSGDGVSGSYGWKMGGDLAALQSRAAIIALNTLRRALIGGDHHDTSTGSR